MLQSIEQNWKSGHYKLTRIVHYKLTRSEEVGKEGVCCLQFDNKKIVGGCSDTTVKVIRHTWYLVSHARPLHANGENEDLVKLAYWFQCNVVQEFSELEVEYSGHDSVNSIFLLFFRCVSLLETTTPTEYHDLYFKAIFYYIVTMCPYSDVS